jgi:hypothetical protein
VSAPALEVRAGWVEFNCVQYRDATEADILAQPCVVQALADARAAWEAAQTDDALLVRTVAAQLRRAAGAEVPSPLAEAEESALLTHPVVVAALRRAREVGEVGGPSVEAIAKAREEERHAAGELLRTADHIRFLLKSLSDGSRSITDTRLDIARALETGMQNTDYNVDNTCFRRAKARS